MFDVNLMAAVGMAQQVVPAMRAQGSGAIVNIGSIGGRVTLPWSTLYCASKYALHSVSEGLYRELKPYQIHVLTVIPGIVDTNFRFHVLAGTPPRASR
jgi:short-subunit dehydrogenase